RRRMRGRTVTPAALAFGAISTFSFVFLATGALLFALGHGPDQEPPVELGMVVQGGVTLFVLLVTVALLRRLRAADVDLGIPFRGRRGAGFHLVGAYALVLCVWVPVFMFAYPAVRSALGLPLEPQPHLAYFTHAHGDLWFWLVVASVCVVGPTFEEVVFRGYLQTAMTAWIGPWPAILTTALLFGFLHGEQYGLPLAAMGTFFGYLRMRDEGMLAPIFVHCLHNSTTIAVTLQWPDVFTEVYGK
ncbi:MAG: CPBP family intramembrane metalloprotease, partial [Planctomycetes bacterium]|nr:CPBP family intramembrane metalloprotease [Planctomycetota bacterium]